MKKRSTPKAVRPKAVQSDELSKQIRTAKKAGAYMVAVWKVEDDRVHLFRMSNEFPFTEIPTALELLQNDFEKLIGEKNGSDNRNRGGLPADLGQQQ
jgi:hypothetical protein